jgi:3D (Asp-Asp-Asp) domain-containing protein
MNKKASIAILSLTLINQLSAKSNKIVDCRLISPSTTECKPYSTKFIITKKIKQFDSNNRLIISKNLPSPSSKKIKIKVVSVEDMIEKYVKVYDPIRFSTHYTSEELKVIARIHQKEDRAKSFPKYRVKKGDSLFVIAKRYNMDTDKILEWNDIEDISKLKLNQEIIIPIEKQKFSKLTKVYKDKLLRVKKQKELRAKKRLALKNKLDRENKLKKKRKQEVKLYPSKKKRLHLSKKKRKLRVLATAYTSHRRETDKTPFLAAWNNRLRPGTKSIAVSRDLIEKYGIRNKQRVKISGLSGYYIVKDKMNRRFKKKIDIYMGLNRRKALKWGRRRVTIYW